MEGMVDRRGPALAPESWLLFRSQYALILVTIPNRLVNSRMLFNKSQGEPGYAGGGGQDSRGIIHSDQGNATVVSMCGPLTEVPEHLDPGLGHICELKGLQVWQSMDINSEVSYNERPAWAFAGGNLKVS